ncbi:hypothetical protein Tco_1124560 [Tanacetum coccineum]|uniref:Reverse transcriptase domain-containing protein n=1 Tax=Tanacetum coccineum TaxID=301880 RepID=A0ABQ5J6K9_9ASTR
MDGESTEAFIERSKAESMHVCEAPECMRISGFMHGITNPDLIKKLNDNISKSIDEMMNVTTAFLRGEIEGAVKSGQLSHLVKEIKQGGRRGEQAKAAKKGEAPNKEKATTIFMVQPWKRITRQKVTQIFSIGREIYFPPLKGDSEQENPIVIEAEVERHLIHRMYVDGGSVLEISITIQWYNRPPGFQKIETVPSTVHGMLKFPMKEGILTICGNTIIPAECRMVAEAPSGPPPQEPTVAKGIKVAIHPEYDRRSKVHSGTSLEYPRRMPAHKEKKKGQAPERNKAIQEEVAKLVEAKIMREVHYHDWLSNPVMVKKHDGSRRMCVNFTDLNKSCPKDFYPFLEIDWKIESLYGYPFKCFLDAYKGYHQIKMAEEDEDKTTFHTS